MPSTAKSTLQTLLQTSAPGQIQDSLLDTIKTASDIEVEALGALLAPLAAKARTKKHCVRCHLIYNENKNHSSACKVEHNDYGETEYETGNDVGITTLDCCGTSFGSEDEPDTKICFSAPHTTDVLYYETENEDKDGLN
jgi:hypothetical protein